MAEGEITLAWFQRGLGLVSLAAFLSFRVQMRGLICHNGISPAKRFLHSIDKMFSLSCGSDTTFLGNCKTQWAKFNIFPTFGWMCCEDWFLVSLCNCGIMASLALVTNLSCFWASMVCFWAYLSLKVVAEPFLSLQMDANLIELHFISMLGYPLRRSHPMVTILLLRFLVFRIMLACGFVKYYGSPMWRKLTAMNVHYWTQPLPNPLSYYFHRLPPWIHKAEVVGTFVVEGPLCLCVFGPYLARLAAFFGFVGLNGMINTTGNYGFLGLMTAVTSFSLLDDHFWPSAGRSLLHYVEARPMEADSPWVLWPCVCCSVLYVLISTVPLLESTKGRVSAPNWLARLQKAARTYRIANYYGKFGAMTPVRWELIVEGSHDGEIWKRYDFKYKPSDPRKRPPVIPMHLPRLDWRLWFLPLDVLRYGRTHHKTIPRWYKSFIRCLLENRIEVLRLLHRNPFPDTPPSFVRTSVVEYKYNYRPAKEEEQSWWTTEFICYYGSMICQDSEQADTPAKRRARDARKED